MDLINKSLNRRDIFSDLLSPLLINDDISMSRETFTAITNHCYCTLKTILSNASVYQFGAKDKSLSNSHVGHAIKEFGFCPPSNEPISDELAHFGGKRKKPPKLEINKKDVFVRQKLTSSACFKGHWLCIDGVQPITVYNPVDFVLESAKSSALLKHDSAKRPICVCDSKTMSIVESFDTYLIKMTDSHLITAEEQLFYVELTKTLVGTSDSRRMEALATLSLDPAVSSVMAPMVVFISEATRENISICNFPTLIYIIRMINALVKNNKIYIEQYLDQLLPCVLSCIVTKEVCAQREFHTQWVLREFAVSTMEKIVSLFDSEITQIKTRVCKVLEKVIKSGYSSTPACYGATYGLMALGHDVVNTYLVPHASYVTDRVNSLAESTYSESLERVAADKYIGFFKTKMADEIVANVPREEEGEYIRRLGRFGIGVAAYMREQRAHGDLRR